MSEEKEELPEVKLQRLESQIEGLKVQLLSAQDQVESLTLHLEVANERWVSTVNENAQLQVQLRKLTKYQGDK